MVKNLIGWMVVGVGWLLDVNDFTITDDGNM
jgi:hypothetical protein